MNRAELKGRSKDQLRGKWGSAILITVVYIVLQGVLDLIIAPVTGGRSTVTNPNTTYDIVSGLGTVVITALLLPGYLAVFFKLSEGEKPVVGDLFSKFNYFFKFLIATIIYTVLVAIGLVLFVIPGIIIGLGLAQVYYILLDEPELSAVEALKKSWKMMTGHKWEYFVLGLSFLGWAIASIFTLFIGLLWLVPYVNMTYLNYYLELKKEVN